MNEARALKLAELIRALRKCANDVELVSPADVKIIPNSTIEVRTPEGILRTQKIGSVLDYVADVCNEIPSRWYFYTDGILIAELNLSEVVG